MKSCGQHDTDRAVSIVIVDRMLPSHDVIATENRIHDRVGEWKPWLAHKLDLGSLPLFDGICVIICSTLPAVAAIGLSIFRVQFGAAIQGHQPSSKLHRQLSDDEKNASCATNTTVSIIVVLIIFAVTLYAFFRSLLSNPNLASIINESAEIERQKYASKQGAETLALGGAQSAYDGAKSAATDATKEAAFDVLKGDGLHIDGTVDSVVSSAEESFNKYFQGKLHATKLWGFFNLGRFCVAETTILIGLISPAFGCATPSIFGWVKAFVGFFGSALALGIPLWLICNMSRSTTGMYRYFPGSQSNKIYELATGIKPRALIPDRGEVSGKMRLNWTTKYQLGCCGVSIGLGLILQFVTAIIQTIYGEPEAAQTWIFFLATVAAKYFEICMYWLLAFLYWLDFTCFVFGLPVCGCCPCYFCPWCRRGYDDDDKKELCSCGGFLSCFSTRSEPPKIKTYECISNDIAVFLEAYFFK